MKFYQTPMITYEVIEVGNPKNVVNFYVHISPIFSCQVTYMITFSVVLLAIANCYTVYYS